jgi:hypothetical protein
MLVTCYQDRSSSLPEHMKKYYNKPIHTNKTIKKPFYCPNGRRNCSMCHMKENGNINKNKKIDFSTNDDSYDIDDGYDYDRN